jgi:UDP-N-acetylmuramoyl-L-alanyl-D-glutamate--2,6-diaminopimelate ligase
MGRAVAQQADLTLVTSDNPRGENPAAIIEMILPGVRDAGRRRLERLGDWNGTPAYFVQPDRATAIAEAIGVAKPGDVVLIAGKGHENYQIVGAARLPFDDCQVAADALAARAGGR